MRQRGLATTGILAVNTLMISQKPSSLHRFANPTRFMRLSSAILPWCAVVSAVFLALGVYLALGVILHNKGVLWGEDRFY